MIRRILVLGACVLALPIVMHPGKAYGAPTEKFSYTANFEEKDPVTFWSGSRDYTVNFKGLTDEKSTEGKKCFKLDVTFGSASEMYWDIRMPASVPAEGSLKFTGNVFLGEGTTASRVDVGAAYTYPPSTVAGACIPVYKVATKEKWLPIQGDLAAVGRTINLGAWTFGNPAVSNVGAYMTNICLHFFGNKGDRVVIYVDDFKVDGEVPSSVEYAKEALVRWQPIKARVNAKVGEWESALTQYSKDIEGITAKTEAAEKVKKEALEKISGLRARVKAAGTRGAVSIRDQRQIDDDIKSIEESKRIIEK